MFRCVSYYLGAFGTVCCVTTLSSKWAKLVPKFVPRSRVGIFHNKPLDPPHWTLISCFVAFRTIWVHLGQFVALQHSVQNGPNSKLMFLCVSYNLDVFGTVWLPTKLGAKRAEVVQKFGP